MRGNTVGIRLGYGTRRKANVTRYMMLLHAASLFELVTETLMRGEVTSSIGQKHDVDASDDALVRRPRCPFTRRLYASNVMMSVDFSACRRKSVMTWSAAHMSKVTVRPVNERTRRGMAQLRVN